MPVAMSAQDVIKKSSNLNQFWSKRNAKFKDWYNLIKMVDTLAQEGMESFVGNDPRAAYNLSLHLLDQKIPHRLEVAEMDKTLIQASSQVEMFYSQAWQDIFSNYRQRGRPNFMRDLIGFILATGWYSVFATISPDGSRCMAEILNPATVFPNWDDVLVECARIQSMSELAAQRMLIRNNWKADVKGTTNLYDYWMADTPRTDGGYNIYNAVVIGQTLVKPPTLVNTVRRIPIFVAPAGGLPDSGVLSADWQEEVGQPALATNVNLYQYWNKWWTFILQILRDSAQPHVFEQSRGSGKIVKDGDMTKRGVIWHGAPEDRIGFVTPPPLPMELRSSMLDMEAMLQRGGPSFAMYGTMQSQMSSFMMAQVTSLTAMMVSAYHDGIINCISDIDNLWMKQIKEFKYKPYNFSWPKEIPDNMDMTAEYEITIPGDISNRATAARMLNPSFALPVARVYEELFPEIIDPLKDMARVRAEEAERNPVYSTIALIQALREQATILQNAKDTVGADLFNKAADRVESTLNPQPTQPAGGAPVGQPTQATPTGIQSVPGAGGA